MAMIRCMAGLVMIHWLAGLAIVGYMARMAMMPIQSPMLEVTCASHRRRNGRIVKTPHGDGLGAGGSGGMNGA